MEWQDEGIVLSARKHGESSAIITLMTRSQGRHAGLVRGGAGRKARGLLQPGNQVSATWRARLAEHLGTFTCEMLHAYAAPLLNDPLRLAGLSAACAVTDISLPEREAHVAVYDGLLALIKAFESDDWPSAYVKWEVGLLGEMGFGLDLSSCAATGSLEDLTYVSPKSGRAVSSEAGQPYINSLLPLPAFLLTEGQAGTVTEVRDGLTLTGYFLERHALHQGQPLPPARQRLLNRLEA